MSRTSRLAGLAVLALALPACSGFPLGLSVGQAFPSEEGAEIGPMYGVHFRALDLADGFGMDFKVHMIEYDVSLNANMIIPIGDTFYAYGGGGYVAGEVSNGDPSAMYEAGLGADVHLVGEYSNRGLFGFVEGGYMGFSLQDFDDVGYPSPNGPGLRVGLTLIP